MNTASKGARLERKVRKILDRVCKVTMRSAASKGAIDVMGVGSCYTYLVQCKAGKSAIGKTERAELESIAKKTKAIVFIVDNADVSVYDLLEQKWLVCRLPGQGWHDGLRYA